MLFSFSIRVHLISPALRNGLNLNKPLRHCSVGASHAGSISQALFICYIAQMCQLSEHRKNTSQLHSTVCELAKQIAHATEKFIAYDTVSVENPTLKWFFWAYLGYVTNSFPNTFLPSCSYGLSADTLLMSSFSWRRILTCLSRALSLVEELS